MIAVDLIAALIGAGLVAYGCGVERRKLLAIVGGGLSGIALVVVFGWLGAKS